MEIDEIESPDKISFNEVFFPLPAMEIQINEAINAMVKDKSPEKAVPINPTERCISTLIVAPNEAPEDVPSRYGSAIGLATNVCITKPDTASEAPVKRINTSLGRRISLRTILV